MCIWFIFVHVNLIKNSGSEKKIEAKRERENERSLKKNGCLSLDDIFGWDFFGSCWLNFSNCICTHTHRHRHIWYRFVVLSIFRTHNGTETCICSAICAIPDVPNGRKRTLHSNDSETHRASYRIVNIEGTFFCSFFEIDPLLLPFSCSFHFPVSD